NAFSEIFEIDLVNDTDAGWNNFEGVERLHAPFEKLIALAIALKFHFEVSLHRIGRAEEINLNRMIDDEIDRNERFNYFRILAEPTGGGTHSRKVDEQRNASKILQDDAGDDEGNFFSAGGVGFPISERADVLFGDAFSIAVAQNGFKDEADGDGQF